jgi:hypothetical protein
MQNLKKPVNIKTTNTKTLKPRVSYNDVFLLINSTIF